MADKQAFEDQLKRAGYRCTAPRRVVLDVIARARRHLTPREVLAGAQARRAGLGRATVYRTLDLLTKIGLVRPLYIGDDGPRYARTEGGHHHMVCTGCGAVIEFEECLACKTGASVSQKHGFRIESHLLELYGRCRRCLQRRRP